MEEKRDMPREITWMKKGACRNLAEYIRETTGHTFEEIMRSSKGVYKCPGIPEAAAILKDAVRKRMHIAVVTDYDADGIGSAAQMFMILRKLGSRDMDIKIPKRVRDGYGLNERIISGIPDGSLVVTVDNGITANGAVAAAKRRGMTVVVLDHHLRNGELPCADLIVDPEDSPQGWTYDRYCGAGLTYKLAEELFPGETEFLDQLSAFAAVSTIADSVDVLGDNRNIILRGLKNLNARRCPEGLSEILNCLEKEKRMEHIGIDDIAFRIAPVFNAPGRLSDDGGVKILNAFFRSGPGSAERAKEIYDINEKRKALVAEAKEMVESGSGDGIYLRGKNILFLYMPSFCEGLCGILAGRLSEEGQKPAFVMTRDSEGNIKGSARSQSGANVFEMLQEASGLLLRFGGHSPAAGFSFEEKDIDAVYRSLEASAPETGQAEKAGFYDFEILPIEIPSVYTGMAQVGVYGHGFPEPIIKVTGGISDLNMMGDEKNHLAFKMSGVRCVAFHQAEKYASLGCPERLTVYGTVGSNWYNGRAYIQFHVMDFTADR